jgi:hypothetical protein
VPNPQALPETEGLGTSSGDSALVSFLDRVPAQPLRQQFEQAPSQLWKEAAKSLEKKDQEKLELIKSRKIGRMADTSPEAQRGGSPPYGHAKDTSVDEVNLILDRAKELNNKDKEATWRPVSAISFHNSYEMHDKYRFLGH